MVTDKGGCNRRQHEVALDGPRIEGDVLCLDVAKTSLKKGAALAWGDTYRRAFELPSPVSGEIVAANAASRINAYPYQGILQVRVASPDEYNALMAFNEYAALTRQLQEYDAWTRELRTT